MNLSFLSAKVKGKIDLCVTTHNVNYLHKKRGLLAKSSIDKSRFKSLPISLLNPSRIQQRIVVDSPDFQRIGVIGI